MKVMTIDPDALLLQEDYDPEQLAEAIVERHYAALHYLAYSILGNADEADDAVQEGIIRALGRIERYRPGSNLKAWLSSIVVNQSREMIRRRKVRRRLRDSLAWIYRSTLPGNSPEDKAVKNESRSTLWTIVNRLGEKHRMPVILRYVHKFSLCEISEILGIREGTVSSRLHYACRKLGQEMAVNDFEDLIAEFLDE
jgi:RNA polymerase sigma-70 factor (ECF subfamily)